MATPVTPTAKDLYEDDPYAWAHDQAALLRAGRFDALDLEHLIEEVEDLAGSLRSAVRSRAQTVIAHLLKLQHSPAQNPRWLGARPSGRNSCACSRTSRHRCGAISTRDA